MERKTQRDATGIVYLIFWALVIGCLMLTSCTTFESGRAVRLEGGASGTIQSRTAEGLYVVLLDKGGFCAVRKERVR